ncbi:DUF2523 domain-containing protein [Undibacterium terreum]|uniref:DUF2523 domain-containing protein n=1 Tax=Undibacterium terreum TaxID=1224302 RepID=A0A916X9T0_9BURK|nr:DUF2523 domain-containing protein [Undibacterium terreum]GGC57726.1 hypothetical protein GCM10011396_00720 [Undibacterium terreum]
MQFLVAALIGGLVQIAASLVGRVLMALFVGYVTYTGFSATTNLIVDQMKSSLLGMPSDIASFLGWLWVDKALSMMVSAFTAALAVKLAGGDKLTKMVIKK